MREFMVGMDALKRQARQRLLSWGTVCLLAVFAAVLLLLRASGQIPDSAHLGWLFGAFAIGAAVLALILAPQEGLRLAFRQMVFVLDDSSITRRRPGFADIAIPLDAISAAWMRGQRLVVSSATLARTIVIPNEVTQFDVLRDEIAKHVRIKDAPRRKTGHGGVLLIVTAASWTIFYVAPSNAVAVVALLVALLTLAIGTWHVWRVVRCGPRLWPAWLITASSWIAAATAILVRWHVLLR